MSTHNIHNNIYPMKSQVSLLYSIIIQCFTERTTNWYNNFYSNQFIYLLIFFNF